MLMRHCERLDRAMEKNDQDWIGTAPRPQDPPLSEHGMLQAALIANDMKDLGIEKILVSPLVRTVQTGHIIAEVLGLGKGCLHVEPGILEEDRSFRGKKRPEPLPCWDPLVLPVMELRKISDKINTEYTPFVDVTHVFDEGALNNVREVAEDGVLKGQVIIERTKKFVSDLIRSDCGTVLVVCHGANVKHAAAMLQEGLAAEEYIVGERNVGCWAEFRPVHDDNVEGPWFAPCGVWQQGPDDPLSPRRMDRTHDS